MADIPSLGICSRVFSQRPLCERAPPARQQLKKKVREKNPPQQQTLRLLFDANHLRQINLRFHGRSFLSETLSPNCLLVFSRVENRAEASGLVDVAAVSLGRGDLTVNPHEEGQSTPQTTSPPASALIILLQPGDHSPRLPSVYLLFPFFSFFFSPLSAPAICSSDPLFLLFCHPRPTLPRPVSRAPRVTGMIKTNTDLILVPNPIVLFFFSPALEHAEY